ncbi:MULTISPECIES: hypothetical protein [unclassified Streptomyces]|uniref:hypothetical protein n=2 Tax=unclassified Streptomyces TaxID=2593676 RepID=UPI00202F67DB|nr:MULTISPECIES: hypothetical protein [unclassified Streptomyces]MCM1973289.1 hypothetical protein [Streptomyces sp. G1]MCX5124391.1 hypothetical protein [Streptomyces sp. NBC_00347]
MAMKKVTVTLPAEVFESIKERVSARGVSAYVAAAVERRVAQDKLHELSDHLEQEYGPVSDEAYDAVLDRIEAIDAWYEERRTGVPAQQPEPGRQAAA